MKLGYFPGCSLEAGAKEFDASLKAVASRLDVELAEIHDWSCCGASSAHATDHRLAVALSARNLALAEEQGLAKVMAPCAACFSRLATARHELSHDAPLAEQVRPMLSRPFENKVEVQNAVALLQSLTPAIKAKASPLSGLKVACYYGCLLLRPPEVAQFDDPENPSSMEEVAAAAGATPVPWARRTECCGAGMSLSRTGSVVRLGRSILESAKAAGAQAVVVACPMCHSNLDLRQSAMERRGEPAARSAAKQPPSGSATRGREPLGMPILFITQLVGLALKVDPAELGLKRHFVSAEGVLAALADAGAPKEQPAR